MLSVYRDMGFFLLALVLYFYILQKGVIYLYEALALLSMTVFYIYVVLRMEKYCTQIESDLKSGKKKLTGDFVV